MNKTIAFIDDKPTIGQILKTYLEEDGNRLLYFENAPSAIEWLDQGNRPALIITDMRMPLMSGDEFYNFHVACLAEQKKTISYSREFFLALYKAAKAHSQGHIIAVRNMDGQVLAAVFLVWDAASAYFLISSYSHANNRSGASALVVLEAMKYVRGKAKSFDFEGSMVRGIANFYKEFGAKQTVYYGVEKYYKPIFRLFLFANWLRTWKIR